MKPKPKRTFYKDKLLVEQYPTEAEMGEAAADRVADHLQAAVVDNGEAALILATGMSQVSFLEALQRRSVAWDRVTVFHLDEYTGLSEDHPASFRKYLKDRILDHVKPAKVHLIDGTADDLDAEMARYAELLRQQPIDVACIGIGENGHLAFNDPPVADFDDPRLVKEVELDERCRTQQVSEGWFPSLEETPPRAVTLTIPAIMSSRFISCVVPGPRKAEAVDNTLNGPIDEACPASVLRWHESAVLMLDQESSARV